MGRFVVCAYVCAELLPIRVRGNVEEVVSITCTVSDN